MSEEINPKKRIYDKQGEGVEYIQKSESMNKGRARTRTDSKRRNRYLLAASSIASASCPPGPIWGQILCMQGMAMRSAANVHRKTRNGVIARNFHYQIACERVFHSLFPITWLCTVQTEQCRSSSESARMPSTSSSLTCC